MYKGDEKEEMTSQSDITSIGASEENLLRKRLRMEVKTTNKKQKLEFGLSESTTASDDESGSLYDNESSKGSDSSFKSVDEESQRSTGRSRTRSSHFRGVSRCAKDGRWQARIRIGRCVKYLGRFKNEIDAARCYDKAARKLHGFRAVLNYPNDDPDYNENTNIGKFTSVGFDDQEVTPAMLSPTHLLTQPTTKTSTATFEQYATKPSFSSTIGPLVESFSTNNQKFDVDLNLKSLFSSGLGSSYMDNLKESYLNLLKPRDVKPVNAPLLSQNPVQLPAMTPISYDGFANRSAVSKFEQYKLGQANDSNAAILAATEALRQSAAQMNGLTRATNDFANDMQRHADHIHNMFLAQL